MQRLNQRQGAKTPGEGIRGSTSLTSACFPWRLGVLAFIPLFLSLGCSQARVTKPLPPEVMANDADAQINFWHELTDQPVCSNDAAFHGLLLYLDSSDPATDYTSRVAALKARKMLPPDFNQPAEVAIQRGTLAVAICRALQIKGGVTMQFLPFSGRYASRELQFMNLYPPGGPNQTFSGNEYVGVIGRLEDYQRGNAADKPAAELLPDAEAATTQPTGG